MPEYRYRILNVFTRGEDPFSGNPLAVIEDGRGLDDARMQSLARQFNLSETTYILPSEHASARVRIFTPTFEMAFAGHPTLGTAHVCRALGLGADELTLEMKAGVIPVKAQGRRWTLQAREPASREVAESPGWLAEMLGVGVGDLGERPLWVNVGSEQLIVPLRSVAAVRRAAPRAELLAQMERPGAESMAYVFAPAEGESTDLRIAKRLTSRFFFPHGPAVIEDPATGSATANLGGWCLIMGYAPGCRFEISQGEQAGRPSTLYLEVDAARRILVSGEVIELGRGVVTL